MCIFRERYCGLKQGKSRRTFEYDLLRSKLNETDIGDINHSRWFCENLDKQIYEEMKFSFKKAINQKLEATKQVRPAGFMTDKMTPLKRTGQCPAVVIPVPEHPLEQHVLVPYMLDFPL